MKTWVTLIYVCFSPFFQMIQALGIRPEAEELVIPWKVSSGESNVTSAH